MTHIVESNRAVGPIKDWFPSTPTMRSVYVLTDPDYRAETGVIARPKAVKGPMRAVPYDEALARLLSRRRAA